LRRDEVVDQSGELGLDATPYFQQLAAFFRRGNFVRLGVFGLQLNSCRD
jgi:hypothetical protein